MRLSKRVGVVVGIEVACLAACVLAFEDQGPLIVHTEGVIAALIAPKLFGVIARRNSYVGPLEQRSINVNHIDRISCCSN
jgi:hypothetical protein